MEQLFYNQMILNEFTTESGLSYIGKTKNLLAAEKLIKQLQDRMAKRTQEQIKKTGYNGPLSGTDIAELIKSSKEIDQINKLFVKEFGFKLFSLNIIPAFITYEKETILINGSNAFTIPPPVLVRDFLSNTPALIFKKDRFYDYNHNMLCSVSITADFFDNRVLRADEVMGIILHEVGHNFDVSIGNYLGDALRMVDVVNDFRSGKIVDAFLQLLPDKLGYMYTKAYSVIASMLPDSLVNLLMAITQATRLINALFKGFKFLDLSGLIDRIATKNPFKIVTSALGFAQEKFADSFPTLYGYGPAYISAMDRMERYFDLELDRDFNTPKDAKAAAPFKNILWFGSAIFSVLTFMFDPHPETQTRARMVLDDVKKLSEDKSFPPKIRATLKHDYEESKKRYDDFLSMSDKDQIAYGHHLSRVFKETYLGGKADLRHWIHQCSAIQSGALRPTKRVNDAKELSKGVR